MTKRRMIALIGALTLMVSSGAFPALADPPETSELDAALAIADTENDLVVFWNITRDGFCDWIDGGMEGPKPVDELVEASFQSTGSGAIVFRYKAKRPLELWNVDDPDNRVGVCEDTVGQTGPWAMGEAVDKANLNNLFGLHTRINLITDKMQGTVFTEDGSRWHYSSVWTAEVVNGELSTINETWNLRKKGK